MNLERMLANAEDLQRIPAPTFHESQRARRMQQLFRSAGLSTASIDDTGNVIAALPDGESPPLLISAHLDTVFPSDTPLTLIRDENRLAGPGIGDNVIALAALIELAHDLQKAPPPFQVILVANVAEEGLGNLAGMRAIVDRYQGHVRAYLVLEGFSQETVVNRALSIRRFRIAVQAQGGHPWAHADRPSAVHVLVGIAQRVLNLRFDRRRYCTINIGRITGGTSINTLAAEASMDIDVRSIRPLALERFEEKLHQLCRHVQVEGSTIQIEEIGSRPAGAIHDNHPLVQAALECLNNQGIAPVQLAIGSTDANIPLSRGFPAVCLGLTQGGGAHSLEEHIQIAPLPRGYAALLSLIHHPCLRT